MLLFAHAGIALGTAVVLNGRGKVRQGNEIGRSTGSTSKTLARSLPFETWLTSLASRIDLRVLLVGAVISDAIDKPLGRVMYGTFGCRLFCHSLLFLLLIALAGFLLYLRRRQNWLLVLGFGVFTHLVLDEMWTDTQTLLWPVLGLSFPSIDYYHWEGDVLHRLLTAPKVYVPEIAGFLIFGLAAWMLARRGKLFALVRSGRIQG